MTTQPTDKERIFTAALELSDVAERRAYVEAACGQDRRLLAEIEGLLKHDEEAGSFINRPALAPPGTIDFHPLTEGPGTVIGPYKLLQKIGEGGFGAVYMAEQQQPVRRKVALKIIKPGMDTREVIARFESERQALALMDHPNIARVLDAGATESRRPYFVMELVKGVPITEYCDKNNLPTEQRLQLFLAVCHAVQHAHQKGIIHRDIKPSNVMVTLHDGKPVPKVIDFGVAKATSQQLTEKTLFTAYGQMIGTPVYMSPEQAEMSGLDIDTRSDIYSLGVLLYELLTGTTPFDGKRLRDAGYVEMQRIIREEEPPRPSTRVSTMGAALTVLSNQRSTDPGKLRQLLRGDLDLIVMKSLEKERTRRYETPSSFAQDVERFLKHEAILARPQSSLYRLRKFAQRNKAAVTAGAAIAATLLLATILSTVLAIHANDQKNQAQANLLALNKQQTQTEEARVKAVTEAARAKAAEALAAEQKQLADQRAMEAEQAQAAEAEQRQAAEEKRQAIEQQKNQIEALNDQLRRSMADQRRSIYAAEMNLVRLEAQRGNLPRLRELLLQQLPGADEEDLRGWEWTYWYRFLNRAQVVRRFEGFVYGAPDSALAIAPGGKLAAITRGDKTEWMDLSSGKVIGSVPVRLRLGVNRTSLASAGRLVGASAISQAAYWPEGYPVKKPTEFAVWEPNGERRTFAFPADSLQHLSFVSLSRDGRRVAAVGNDVSHQREKPACRLLVWDVDSGELVLNQVQQRELNRLALNDDGQLLAAWVCHSTARHRDELREVAVIVNVATGAVLGTARHNDDVDMAYLLPDGKQLLLATLGYSGANRKELWTWSVGSDMPRKLTSEQMPDYVKGAVSPDGRLFAVSGHTVSTVRLIDTQRGNLVATLHNEATTIDSLTFTPDSRQFVACSTSGEVLQWDLGKDDDLFRLRSRPLGPMSYHGYALSSDQSRLAYVTAQGSVRLRTVDGEETVLCPENALAVAKQTRGIALLQFSPNGKFLAYSTTLRDDGLMRNAFEAVELFDVVQGKRAWQWTPADSTTRQVFQLEFSADSQQVLILSPRGQVVGLSCSNQEPQPKTLVAATGTTSGMWVDRSGQMVVATRTTGNAAGGKASLTMREILSGQTLGRLSLDFKIGYRLTHSPDGQHLAITGYQPDRVALWNFVDQRQVLEVPGNAVTFSSDGKLLAIGDATRVSDARVGVSAGGVVLRVKAVTLWDVTTGSLVASISLAGNHADEMRFSPDGHRLLTLHGKHAMGAGGAVPEVRLWDIPSGREIMAIAVAEVNHYIWDVFYDPTGNRLTVMVFAKSMGTSGGWGSTVLDATPLSEDESAQLIARRLVKDLLSRNPLPGDAVAKLEADPKLRPSVREAAVALAKKQPLVPDQLAAFCAEAIGQSNPTTEQQQMTLRVARTLQEAEPGSLRSQILLGGAQFRAGQAAEALATLRQADQVPLKDLEPLSIQDQLYGVSSVAICLLAEHQLGNRDGASQQQAALTSRMRELTIASRTSPEYYMYSGLVGEALLVREAFRSSMPYSGFVPTDDLLRRSFERMDANRDGQLTQVESGNFSIWPELLLADANADGQLTLAEFIEGMQTRFFSRQPAPRIAPETKPEFSQQLKEYATTLAGDPQSVPALVGRAKLLASCPDERYRNGPEAVAHANQACELTKWQNPFAIDSLAMASAEAGDFAAAVKYQKQALAAAPPGSKAELESRLALYREHRPFRLPGRYEAIAGWGRLADPTGNCQVESKDGILRIKTPAGQYNLSPISKGTDAPRLLQEVEGDFTAQVKVTCPIAPQTGLANESTINHGAGLLVFVDPAHFLRAERNGYYRDWDKTRSSRKSGRSPLSSNAPTLEYWRDGAIVTQRANWSGELPQLPGDSTWLRIERRGTQLHIALSHDGQSWEKVQTVATSFPPQVQVGVLAVNSSGDPFSAEFSEFKLSRP